MSKARSKPDVAGSVDSVPPATEFQPPLQPAPGEGSWKSYIPSWSSVAASAAFLLAAVYIYVEAFRFASFGPEFAYFYDLNHSMTLGGLLAKYLEVGVGWYRPTEFYLPYWFLSKFIGWHSIVYWKIANFLTLLLLCAAVYRLVRILFPEERLGAFLAIVYFISHPAHYLVLFEISAFDFLHQIFTVAAVCFFLAACREPARRTRLYNAAGALCFALALTSKEITFFTPVYLAAACAAVAFLGAREARKAQAQRHIRLLAPYAMLLVLYLLLHLARMPSRPADSAYRTQANSAMILENLGKFPLWVIRVFSDTGDTWSQANEQGILANTIVGYALFLLVAAQWSVDLKSRDLRLPGILMIVWIPIFLVLPTYSGAFLWHMSLALTGYAALLGVAVARLAKSARAPVVRNGAILLFVGVLVVLGKDNLFRTLHNGVHTTAFRLNTQQLLTAPPIARSALRPESMIFVEDRLSLGNWSYGSGQLFRLTYLKPDLQVSVIPALADAPPDAALRWAQGKGDRFLRYDSDLKWQDATNDFGALLPSQLHKQANALFMAGRAKDVPDLLRPFLPSLASDGIAHYHYALGLQHQGRAEESLKEYAEALRLAPDQFFAYFNRASLLGSLNRKRDACSDISKARSMNPTYPGLDRLTQSWCQ